MGAPMLPWMAMLSLSRIAHLSGWVKKPLQTFAQFQLGSYAEEQMIEAHPWCCGWRC